jgi:hypothetical protein
MSGYDPEALRKLALTQEFSVQSRVDVAPEVIATWDGDLLREPRVCVPIDVQALVVPPGAAAGTEGVVLVGPLSPGSGAGELGGGLAVGDAHATVTGPDPFASPTPRPPGVHLHWAMPDALLRGALADPSTAPRPPASGPSAAGGGAGMAALPDRWLVLRLLAPAAGAGTDVARGWVLDAATGRTWDLSAWTGDPQGAGADELPGTPDVPPEGLTGAAGGTLTWTAGYDAAARRFAFHDPLDDLAADPALGGTLPGGPVADGATYTVIGWSRGDLTRWTRSAAPRASTGAWQSWAGRCSRRRHRRPARRRARRRRREARVRRAALTDLGVSYAGAHGTAVDAGQPFDAKAAFAPGLLAGMPTSRSHVPPKAPPRPEASTLLHGCVVGVPVAGDVAARVTAAELRPATTAASTGLGEHLFDALALAADRSAARLGVTGETELAVVERLVAAFVRHELQLLADPAGAAEIDASLHAGGFTSVESGEAAAVDRLVDGQVAPLPRGRRIGTVSTNVKGVKSVVLEAGATRYEAMRKVFRQSGTADTVDGASTTGVTASSPGSAGPAATAASSAAPQVRTEERPAPPRWVPNDPYLAIVGAGRSLRHGGDGRWTSAGVLRSATRASSRSTSPARCTARTCSSLCRRAPSRARRATSPGRHCCSLPTWRRGSRLGQPARRAAARPAPTASGSRPSTCCATTRPVPTRPRPASRRRPSRSWMPSGGRATPTRTPSIAQGLRDHSMLAGVDPSRSGHGLGSAGRRCGWSTRSMSSRAVSRRRQAGSWARPISPSSGHRPGSGRRRGHGDRPRASVERDRHRAR